MYKYFRNDELHSGQIIWGVLPYLNSDDPPKYRPYLVLSVNYQYQTMQIVEIASTDREHEKKRDYPNIHLFGRPPGIGVVNPLDRGSGISCESRQTLTFRSYAAHHMRTTGEFPRDLTLELSHIVSVYEGVDRIIRDSLVKEAEIRGETLDPQSINQQAVWRIMRRNKFHI